MSDANPTSEAGAGAEALLGLAAQAGQAVRLPSLPSLSEQPSATHTPFLPTPPSLSLPTQPQPLQSQPQPQPQPQPQTQPQPRQPPPSTLQPQQPDAQLQPPPATLSTPSALARERLPTLSEWADPAFRPFPPPLLAPLPDRWQASAPVPPPPSQYPYHNPWQSYPYPPPYYYYQQQNLSYPVPHQHQPPVAPIPPPLALPTPPMVPPLRVPLHTDPIREAVATNESSAFPPPIPQPPTVSSRDPLLERLTNEAAAIPKKTHSRAPGLADLMNPTDTIPSSSTAMGQSRMENPLIKPESIETKVTPVTVPSVPSAEPKLSDIVKTPPHNAKFDLAVIAGVSAENLDKGPPEKPEIVDREEKSQKEPEEDNGVKGELQPEKSTSQDQRQPQAERETQITEPADARAPPDEREEDQEKVFTDSLPKENKDIPVQKIDSASQQDLDEKKDETGSQQDLMEAEDEDGAMEKEDGDSGDEETRCPCGSKVSSGIMIACDQCNTWQHSKCMGFRRGSEVPEKYYCHICRPDEIRPTCIAHPKYKDRSGRERSALDRRDYESQLIAVKPVDLRKLFVSDMRHKKTLMRSKADVFSRYASHVKNHYGKHRTSVIDGLVVLLDMQRQEVVERLDSVLRKLRPEKPEELERKRSGTITPNEGPASEIGSTRTPGNCRGQTQKRARPHSASMEGLEGANGVRGESFEALGDFDLGADAVHGRNMSREERKLQQTMKLFARMEEREREKKKPRTGDISASPRAGPPSRSRTPRPSNVRTASPKSSTTAIDTEDGVRKATSEARQDVDTTESPEQKAGPKSETGIADMPQQNQEQENVSQQPKIVQPSPQQKSSLTSRSDNEIGKKEREPRKDRLERTTPRRKESCSPDNLNGNTNGRRRSILARERSQDSKRRRVGLSRESEKRNCACKEQQKRDSSLEFAVVLPGPSVIGSRKIAKTRLSKIDREFREKEETLVKHDCDQDASNGSRKERFLEDAREEEIKKLLNGGRSPSPMKKRYGRDGVLQEEESDDDALTEEKESDKEHKDSPVNGKAGETLSVSMVVVSEKGSLPDRGQILESTRLILPGANGKMEDTLAGKSDTVRRTCLKKRPVMLSANSEVNDSEDPEGSPKPTITEKAAAKETTPLKMSTSPPSPQKSPPSPMNRVASPKLRSFPPPVLRSPNLRSVPAEDARQPVRSPSPLPSFKSQKLSPPVQKRWSQSPENEQKREEETSGLARKGTSPAHSIEDKARRKPPDSSGVIGLSGEQPKSSEGFAPGSSTTKAGLDPKNIPNSAAPPLLRSIRSVPPPSKNVEEADGKPQNAGRDVSKDVASGDQTQPVTGKRLSGSATISDIFQRRVQGFLRPSGASPSPSPRGPESKYGFSSPLPSPRASNPHASVVSPASSVRGSAAKLGAALPLSCKPNLDGLRNSNGLSPRVSGSGHIYSRNYGTNFRSKPGDADRSWNSVPSFSSLKRHHSFGRGSRGSSLIGGKPGSFSGVDRGRHGHGRDGLPSYGREDMMDKNRSGYRRDGPFLGRDDEKIHSGNPHTWNRPYTQRPGWGGGGPSHHSSGDGPGRGSRR